MKEIQVIKVNILLVEDNLADAKLFKKAIVDANDIKYNIVNARSLDQALDLLNKDRFDIIVLDLFLPDEQGLDTFKSIYLNYSHIPIIILSGLTSENIAIEAIKLGAQDYLIKGPHFFAVLERSIKYAIFRKKQEQEIKDLNSTLENRLLELAQANYALESTHKKLHEYKDENIFAYQSKLELTSQMLSLIQATSKSSCEAIKLLYKTNLTGEQKELLNIIELSCKNIYDKTIKSMFYPNLRESVLALQNSTFNLEQSINNTVELFIPFLKEKNISYSIYIDPNLPDTFDSDEFKIKQILMALMHNTIKSANNGSIYIRVELANSFKQDNYEVSVTINSSNNTIDQNFLKLLLDDPNKFNTLENYEENVLNIVLCRTYVNLFKGKIDVVSNNANELTIRCSLPLHAVNLKTSPEIKPFKSDTKIIVVCDNIVESKHINEYLNYISCEAKFVTNIDSCLEELLLARQVNNSYNLCIIDLESDFITLQLINKIVYNSQLKKVKLIVIGNNKLDELSNDLNVYAHLPKPFNKDELFIAISNLNKPILDNSLANEIKPGESVTVTKKTFRPQILVAEDNLTLQKMIVKQLEKLNINCDVVSDGRQACNLAIQKHYDLIILDYQMPIMNGSQACKIIRSVEKYNNTICPIVMMSSCASFDEIQGAIKNGANEFIFKPIGLTDINSILNRYVFSGNNLDQFPNKPVLTKASENTLNKPNLRVKGTTGVLCDINKLSVAKIIECIETKILENETLGLLANHNNPDIRAALALSPYTPDYILAFLQYDSDVNVRFNLAENHLLPTEILENLCNDENAYVAHRAKKTIDNIKP